LSKDINIAEQIKDRVDTVETIDRVVSLRRSGKSWSGLCPFHKEKTASFHVYEDSGNYICFGCGAKGDIITFYEKYYNIGFLDACERLSKENGIDWQPGGSFSADKGKEALYEVNRGARSVYYKAMKVEGNPALEYMLGRGLDRMTISKFRIGYADESGRMLAAKLENDEKMRKAALEVGLINEYSGGRLRDRFEGRVMFPIVSTRGKVIGFGGRDVKGEAKAKYINSAASSVYAKGSNLYGLDVTQEDIRKQGYAVLVEGYMDLVMLYMHGVRNVCAQLGTAFTRQQAKLLGKYTKNIVLALDSDESGRKAALASMDVLAEAGLKVRVLVLEGAKDPDDFIRAYGKERFEEALGRATPMYDYKLDLIREEHDLNASDGLADFLKEAAKLIAPLSPVERDFYIKKLSQESGISENAIAMQVEGSAAGEKERHGYERAEIKKPAPSDDLLCGILALALTSAYAFDKAAGYRHFFTGSDYTGVMDAMLTLKGNTGAAPTTAELTEALNEADQAALDTVLRKAAKGSGSEDGIQIDEYLAKLEIVMLKAKEEELKYAAGTDESLLKELMEIQNRIKLLENDIRCGRRGE